jgi:diphthamide biosynthesis protein 2
MSIATLSSPDNIHGRQLESESVTACSAGASWDIAGTAAHIRRGFRRVALQFPDALLGLAPDVMHALEAELRVGGEGEPPAELFVLADTSFDGYQLDFVAAQHVAADLLVHYGPADLNAHGPIEARYVFGDEPLDVGGVAAVIAAKFPADQPLVVVPALRFAHAAAELSALLAMVVPRAVVAMAEVERRAGDGQGGAGAGAVECPSAGRASLPATATKASGMTSPSAATPAVAACAAEATAAEGTAAAGAVAGGTASAVEAAAAAAALGAAAGLSKDASSRVTEILGRRLLRPLSRDELRGCPLLYLGGPDEPTLANLAVLFSESDVHVCGGGSAGDADPAAETSLSVGESNGAVHTLVNGSAPPTVLADMSEKVRISRVELHTSRRLQRRYFLVQKAKEAAVLGVLIGTLSASDRSPMLRAVVRLIRARGRKHYVFLMGKLNAAKLANFTEVRAGNSPRGRLVGYGYLLPTGGAWPADCV